MIEQEIEQFRKLTRSCWYLAGPTGVGKSKVGLALAKTLNAEIISMDSMAVYKEMDVGTAKLDREHQEGIPHHLIDLVEPNEEYSLARYVQDAAAKIKEIRRRKHEVLFVGGTGMYLKAMLRGIFDGPPASKEFREQLREKMDGKPPETLHQLLKKVDPASAKRLHPNDAKRIIRALEVFELAKKPIGEFQKQWEVGMPAKQCNVYVLQLPRDVLHTRINKRVDRMMYDGLLDEAKALRERKKPIGKTAAQALGYKEMFDYIDGKTKFGEAVELVRLHTRQFAKRQETWFRGLCECRFISADNPEFEGLPEIIEEGSEPVTAGDAESKI
jgi:tRNA dimethylallyltransferase